MKKFIIALAVLAVCLSIIAPAYAQFKDEKIDANAAIKGSKIEYPTFAAVTDGSAPTAAAYLTYTKRALKIGDIIRKTGTAEYFKCTSLTGPAWKPLAGGNSDGTAALPAYSFASDPNTGMYWIGADQIGFSTGGTLRLSLSTTLLTTTLPLVLPAGAAATPSLYFSGDVNTGLYWIAAERLGFAANGAISMELNSTSVMPALPVVSTDGAVGTPALTFVGDLNTGIYHTAGNSDTILFSTGGAQILSMGATDITVPGGKNLIITDLPAAATEAANKGYVDAQVVNRYLPVQLTIPAAGSTAYTHAIAAPGAMTISAVELACTVVPTDAGANTATIAVTKNAATTLLAAATFDMETLVAVTGQSLALTAVGADKILAAHDTVWATVIFGAGIADPHGCSLLFTYTP